MSNLFLLLGLLFGVAISARPTTIVGTPFARKKMHDLRTMHEQFGVIPLDFTYCGSSDQKITISSVSLASAPQSGQVLDLRITGVTKVAIGITQIAYTLKSGICVLFEDSADYKVSYKAGVTVNYRYQVTLPNFISEGGYDSVFSFNNDSGSLSCIQFSTQIGHSKLKQIDPITPQRL